MPLRKVLLTTNEFYHVLNRGVASLPIFRKVSDYKRFLSLVDYYRFSDANLSYSKFADFSSEERIKFKDKNLNNPQVEILAYCLMHNHFHFLLKQVNDNGILKFMSSLQNAYSKYFNIKTDRNGPLSQGRFKAIWIENEEILLHISRYIHLNPSTSYLVNSENLTSYKWFSLPEYIGGVQSLFINTGLILNTAGGIKNYKKFVFDQLDYQRKLDSIKHLFLE
ncbi:MAG: transposase [Patescibacteria group bacterium]